MKLSLRRAADAPESADDTPPPAPAPPRGRPVVAYAAVDGRTLWLAVPAGPGSLGLRDAEGAVVQLPSTVADEQPGYLSARVDLDELLTPGAGTATGTTSYDAVLVSGSGNAKALWAHPLPARTDTRPQAFDDDHLWDLARLDDGTLRVTRTLRPAGVWLRSVRLDGDSVIVTTDPVEQAEPELRLVEPEGAVVLTRPMTTGDDGLLHASLSVADLPPGDEAWPRVHVGDLPVWRRHDDLVRAEFATVLPLLFGEDLDTPAVRFRFAPDGMLALRLAPRSQAAES